MRIIDADRYQKDLLSAYDDVSMEFEVLDRQPLVNAIVIPERATNGDMLTALFGEKALITLDTHNYLNKWWNAPYKTKTEENWTNFAEELKDVFEERED